MSKTQKRKQSKSNDHSANQAAIPETGAEDSQMQNIGIPDGEPTTTGHEDEPTKEVPSAPEVNDAQKDTLVENAVDTVDAVDAEVPASVEMQIEEQIEEPVEELVEEQAAEADIVMQETTVEKNLVILSSAADIDEAPRYVSQGVQTDDVMVVEPVTEPSQAGSSILGSLRKVLTGIRNVTFGRNVLREIDDVMFDIRVEAHEAARRSQAYP
jgi:hypothetical protein